MSHIVVFVLILLILAAGVSGFFYWYNKNKKPSQGRYVQRPPTLKNKNQFKQKKEPQQERKNVQKIPVINDFEHDFEEPTLNNKPRMEIEEPMMEASKSRKKTGEVIVLGLLAEENRPYQGYELLQTLLTTGLRFNRRGVFYRHENINGRGDILFTLISAEPPGIFDLPKMGQFSTRGLTLFLELDMVKDPLKALEIMLNTAEELVLELGGEIWDDERNPLQPEKINQWRTQIQQLWD